MADKSSSMTNGAASAAILASGVGCFAIGLLTTLAEASAAIKDGLNLYNPVGPLSGKTLLGVLVWAIAWAVFHVLWKDKSMPFQRVFTATLILVALGFLLTFPPFFALFAAE